MTTWLIVWALTLRRETLYFRSHADCTQYVENGDPPHIVRGCHKTGPVDLREFTEPPGLKGGGGDYSGQSASG